MSTLGFVGVGRMGANMARRAKDCGYTIAAVYDVDVARAQELADEIGGVACRNLADVTQLADTIITVVTNDAAMEGIFFGTEGNLLMGAKGKQFINCATLTPAMQIKCADAALAAGADSVEACMASSISHAREGKLYLMIGATAASFERAKPLLEQLSVSMRHVGEIGRASEVKALVNMVMNMNTAALAEGLGLADALGLDLDMIREVFSQTGANSRVLETDAGDMQAREHDCWFSAEHAAKDSHIALALGVARGLSLPIAAATAAQYDKMVAKGLGQLDKSGIAELTFLGRHGSSS